MSNNESRIRIAIQRAGRMTDASLRLLNECGIAVFPEKDQLFCRSDNFPMDLLLVRDDDIPNFVADGICDYGIVGNNLLGEKSLPYRVIKPLGFATCRLSIAVPNDFIYQNIASLKDCRIATSYPTLLSAFIKKSNINATLITLAGSVEIAPRLGIADAICDLVSTGKTLKTNGLREVETVFESEAVLITSDKKPPTHKISVLEEFQQRLQLTMKGETLC